MMVGRVFLVLTGACQFGHGVGGFTTNFIHSIERLGVAGASLFSYKKNERPLAKKKNQPTHKKRSQEHTTQVPRRPQRQHASHLRYYCTAKNAARSQYRSFAGGTCAEAGWAHAASCRSIEMGSMNMSSARRYSVNANALLAGNAAL